jgi:thioredoxin-related protein
VKTFVVAVLVMLLTSGGMAGDRQHTFDPKRDAAKDIANALVDAKKSGKNVLLDVGGEWCVWCRRLDSLFASHADLRKYMESHYVVVKVNYSKENENKEVLSHYPKVAGYPHLFVLDPEGRVLHSQDTGQLESGKGHDPAKVMAFLKRWAPGAHHE